MPTISMKIASVSPQPDWILTITSEDGIIGNFDVKPYLEFDAFTELKDILQFRKITNGRYFVEWDCGADLSADTIEAQWVIVDTPIAQPA